MVTTEIPGEPVGHHPVGMVAAAAIRAAGRDLAVINLALAMRRAGALLHS